MKINFDNSDFEKFHRHIEELDKELQNTSDIVPMNEVITDSFIRNCSNLATIDGLLEAGGFIVKSQEDFDTIPKVDLDSHVRKVTTFNSWEELFGAAVDEYTISKLEL